MSHRLKDKVWPECRIVINRLVEQTVDRFNGLHCTENKTVRYLVTIHRGGGRMTMFSAGSRQELWASLIEHSMVAPTDSELERMRAKARRARKQTPMWRQILEGEK